MEGGVGMRGVLGGRRGWEGRPRWKEGLGGEIFWLPGAVFCTPIREVYI